MSVWATRPVADVPTIVLRQWGVFQTETGERHFAGYNVYEGEGRCSSAITTYDPVTKRGVTQTGRVYQLLDHPGLTGDGLYVKNRWCEINRVSEEIDVTEEYV